MSDLDQILSHTDSQELHRLRAENERLHRQLVSDINAETEIDRLETENERLRAALKEIEDFPYVGTQASTKIRLIARAALADQGEGIGVPAPRNTD